MWCRKVQPSASFLHHTLIYFHCIARAYLALGRRHESTGAAQFHQFPVFDGIQAVLRFFHAFENLHCIPDCAAAFSVLIPINHPVFARFFPS
jgi:hypothetical protein